VKECLKKAMEAFDEGQDISNALNREGAKEI